MAEHEGPDHYFIRELDKNDGSCLKLKQCYIGDVGCVVWDAAIALSKYLETKQFIDSSTELNAWAGKRVVELGAGTGVVGLMAATLGAHVFVTDLEELESLMNLNIKENQGLVNKGSITAKVLKWGEDVSDFMPHPHYILMADCIYYEQAVVPLVETLKLLAGPETCIICCYEQRTEGVNPKVENIFFELLKQSFSIKEIPLDQQDPDYSCTEIRILHICKKL